MWATVGAGRRGGGSQTTCCNFKGMWDLTGNAAMCNISWTEGHCFLPRPLSSAGLRCTNPEGESAGEAEFCPWHLNISQYLGLIWPEESGKDTEVLPLKFSVMIKEALAIIYAEERFWWEAHGGSLKPRWEGMKRRIRNGNPGSADLKGPRAGWRVPLI